MDYAQIASEIETSHFADSAVHKYMGSNVKSPGLVKGSYYVVKYWSLKSLLPNSDNQFWVGQFIGAGEDPERIFVETPRAKSMTSNQRYYFKHPNGEIVAARNFNGALVVNDDDEQRITFYALLNEARQDALPLAAPTARADKSRAVEPVKAPRERVASVSKPAQRIQRPRESRTEDYPVPANLAELFKQSPPPVHRIFLVAQFPSENEAKIFAEQFVDGNYTLDGFAHTAQVPEDLNDVARFLSQAKGSSATSWYRRSVIVKDI